MTPVDLGNPEDGLITFKLENKEFTVDIFEILIKIAACLKTQGLIADEEDENFTQNAILRNEGVYDVLREYLYAIGVEIASKFVLIKMLKSIMAEITNIKKNSPLTQNLQGIME